MILRPAASRTIIFRPISPRPPRGRMRTVSERVVVSGAVVVIEAGNPVKSRGLGSSDAQSKGARGESQILCSAFEFANRFLRSDPALFDAVTGHLTAVVKCIQLRDLLDTPFVGVRTTAVEHAAARQIDRRRHFPCQTDVLAWSAFQLRNGAHQ